ncbi:MAG: ATP-grasp domain-containing protein [Deltaproteobacteria bacterium]|nr:ATP-grasp domain-containing protein [Deltaproteobacteria bacterium]
MYLGIDYLITHWPKGHLWRDLKVFVIEVNVGLPGGAQEYDLAHLVYFGKPSNIFTRIEETSLKVYGKAFKDYLHSLPLIQSLKPFKLWMDGKGPFPTIMHPGLRLEDKWVQYQLLRSIVPMPETIALDPRDLVAAESFLEKKKKAVLKRRVGRGGRGFRFIVDPSSLSALKQEEHSLLLQEYIEAQINGYVFSIRAVAFGGEFMCMYANLSHRSYSNHGIIVLVSPGDRLGLADKEFATESFNQKSWEAEIWFGEDDPPYLRHNLYEDEVARTTLYLPAPLYSLIMELSVKIERLYEGLDLSSLPKACFEPLVSHA